MCIYNNYFLYFNISFLGIIDIINIQKIKCNDKNNIEHIILSERNDGKTWEKALKDRAILVDKLSEFDDDLAHHIISCESLDAISKGHIVRAVRSATCSHVSKL